MNNNTVNIVTDDSFDVDTRWLVSNRKNAVLKELAARGTPLERIRYPDLALWILKRYDDTGFDAQEATDAWEQYRKAVDCWRTP